MTLPLSSDLRMLDAAVKKARAQSDFLMVSFHQHWAGAPNPNPRRSDPNNRRILPADLNDPVNRVAEGRSLICRAAIDAGADVVIGHGPHVLNGVEIYKGKPIIYSLGHTTWRSQERQGAAGFRFNPGMVASVENNWYLEEHRWAAIARMFVRGKPRPGSKILPVDDGCAEGRVSGASKRCRCGSHQRGDDRTLEAVRHDTSHQRLVHGGGGH